MSVETDVVYQGQLRCQATHVPSKGTLITDAPVDNGGQGAAFSPTDLVSAALGTCMLTIMGLAVERSGLDIKGTHIHVTKEMSSSPPRRVSSLRVTITMPKGKNYSEADRKKLEHAAQACPVKHSLHPEISIPIEFIYPK